MGQFTHSKTVPLPDPDMKTCEWLHERIRNEYEHFVPKYYRAPVTDLIASTQLCLDVSKKLLFDSGNVLFHAIAGEELQGLFDEVCVQLPNGKKDNMTWWKQTRDDLGTLAPVGLSFALLLSSALVIFNVDFRLPELSSAERQGIGFKRFQHSGRHRRPRCIELF